MDGEGAGDQGEQAFTAPWPLLPFRDPADAMLPGLGPLPAWGWGVTPHLPTNHRPASASKEYHVITGVILLVCSVIGATGNGIIIAVVLRRRLFQSVTHILVMNLSAAHILLSLTVTPIQAAMYLQQGSWPGGTALCRTVIYLHAVFSSAAIMTLSTIAIDRYYSVVYPLDRKLSLFKGKLMIFYVWFHATVVSLPKVFVSKTEELPWGRIDCDEYWDQPIQGQVYLICYTVLTIFVPLFVTCLAYCFVWKAFRISQRRVNVNNQRRAKSGSFLPYASRTEARLFKMLFLMVFCFVTLWAPYVVYLFMKYFSENHHLISQYFILTATWICKLQPILDPLIYGYLNKQFRQSLYLILHLCHIRCTCPDGFISETTITSTNHPYSSEPSEHPETPSPQPQPQPQPQAENPQPAPPATIKHLSIRGVYIQKDVHYSVGVERNTNVEVDCLQRQVGRQRCENGLKNVKKTSSSNSVVPVGDLHSLSSPSLIRKNCQGTDAKSKRNKNRVSTGTLPEMNRGGSIFLQNRVSPGIRLDPEPSVTVFTTPSSVQTVFPNSSLSGSRDSGMLQPNLAVYPGDIFMPRQGMLPPITQGGSSDESKSPQSSENLGSTSKSTTSKRKRKKILSKRLAMKHQAQIEQELKRYSHKSQLSGDRPTF